MKRLLYLVTGLALWLQACKKEDNVLPTMATINIVNAVQGATGIKVNPSGKDIPWDSIPDIQNYGTGKLHFAPTGTASVQIVEGADKDKKIYEGRFEAKSAVYSLFLAGISGAVDAVWFEEKDFPFIPSDIIQSSADSVVTLRFVNLSPNSPALKINIKNSTAVEATGLAYKSYTDWKRYPAKLTSTTYTFEIRNSATDALLLSYNFVANANNRFRNVALVVRGQVGGTGTNALEVTAANYF